MRLSHASVWRNELDFSARRRGTEEGVGVGFQQLDSLADLDGELFYIITNGRGKMVGGEGDRTKDEVR